MAAYPGRRRGGLTFTLFGAFFAFLFVFALLAAPKAFAAEKLSLRYLRGVYVLRHLESGDHWPALAVPRQVRTHDTTSALLAHPDTAFVLESVARDLAAATESGAYPESGYYAARAFSSLGRHAEASRAMKTYLAGAKFRDEDYLFLIRELYAAANYRGTLAAARQWQALDHDLDACSEDRLTYIWGSLQAMNRHREAMEEVLADPCASWQGQLFFAKSSLDLGDEEGAQNRVEAVLEAFPEKQQEIAALWDRLRAARRFP